MRALSIVVAILAGVIVICSLVIASIVGVDGQDQGPNDYIDCLYFVDDGDTDGRADACSGIIGTSVISMLFGIVVLGALFVSNVRLGLITLVFSILWTLAWLVLASYMTHGWNVTCDYFTKNCNCDCKDVCDSIDVDYDSLNSTIAMAWITCASWLIGSVLLFLSRRGS